MLHSLGVATFRQIAHWTERDIAEFDAKLPEFPGRIVRDQWVTQARALHQLQVRRTGVSSRCGAHAARQPVPASSLLLVVILALVWGCNWPVLKLGVTGPGAADVPGDHAAVCRAGVASHRETLRRVDASSALALWPRVAVLALFNIAGWNWLIVFGIQQMSAGRAAILAYTLPIWSVLFSFWLLHEPLSRANSRGCSSAWAA